MSPAERLIGREPALAAAASVLRDARGGSGQFLMVSGEAGIGKTAVLAALVDQAGPQSLVLRGFCWEGSGVPPYWPWSQVLRVTGIPAHKLGEAGWLLEAGSRSPGGPGGPGGMDAAAAADAQFRLFEAVSRCLAELARDRLVLVVLDDLHWADEPSLRLLGFVSRALAASRVLLLGAYRDTEASADLQQLAGAAQQLALVGLSQAEVEAMVDAMVGTMVDRTAGGMAAAMPAPGPASPVRAQLWRRSGGNPFFVRELTRLLVAQGSWHEQTQIPASVAETLRRRLARLSSRCVQLLEWAAVAGRDIDLSLIGQSHVADNDAEMLGLLDEARQAGVIVGSSQPRFTHDLYRETLLAGLNGPTKAAINLSVGRVLQRRSGGAARVAAHLVAAGAKEAFQYSILAAQEASARLGHDDASVHYLRALQLIDEPKVDEHGAGGRGAGGRGQLEHGTMVRTEILLQLAAAYERSGMSGLAMQRFLEAAEAARRDADAAGLARAALGVQTLGHRSGAQNVEAVELLREASEHLTAGSGPLALQSKVLAALARAVRHGSARLPDADVVRAAQRAVDLATAAGDTHALAIANLAVHDSMWRAGTAAGRLPIIAAMLKAAQASGDNDLVAEAHLLRAAALIELGDPEGREELLVYVRLAGELGHARGRWGALTRQATFAQLAGRHEDSARFGEQALELGLAIGVPDAVACFCTSRWPLAVFGVPAPTMEMDSDDPLWPLFPLFNAWPHAARGELAEAAVALGDFSVLDVAIWEGKEALAVAAVVFSAVGSDAQRAWTYEQLLPYAGTHVLVAGCASYHAAVDHHLGTLAAALGNRGAAEQHLRDALAMHQRLGAAGWGRLSEQALAGLSPSPANCRANEFRFVDGFWLLSFRGRQAQLPDAKGLGDIRVLIDAHGGDVHVLRLVGNDFAASGADPVLDRRAKAEFKARLDMLAMEIDEADADRAELLRAERDALIHELAAAAGLGGRRRRLGDETERARKTVSARVRDALSKIERVNPDLASHLRSSLRMGTACAYTPREPTIWTLN